MKKSKKVKLLSALGGSAIVASSAVVLSSCSTITPEGITPGVTIYGSQNVYAKAGELKSEHYKAVITPISDDQRVKWSTTTLPKGVSFDTTTGDLTINSTDSIEETKITITATSIIDETQYNVMDVTVSVGEADATDVLITCLDSEVVQSGTNTKKTYEGWGGAVQFITTVSPDNANQSVTWTQLYGFVPGIALNNGVITWNKDVKPKRNATTGEIEPYQLVFEAASTTNPNVTKQFILNLDVQDASPTDVIVKGQLQIVTNKNVSGEEQYSVSVLPEQVAQDVTWDFEGDAYTQEVAEIDENGKLSYNLNKDKTGTFKGTVTATSNVNPDISGSLDVSITIDEVAPQSISIEVPAQIEIACGESGQESGAGFVANVSPAAASQKVKWQFTNLPENVSIDGETCITTYTADTIPGEYPVTVWAISAFDENIKSDPLITSVNIRRPYITSVDIHGESTINTYINQEQTTTYTAEVSPAKSLQDVDWSFTRAAGRSEDEVVWDQDKHTITVNFATASGDADYDVGTISVTTKQTVGPVLTKELAIKAHVVDRDVEQIDIQGQQEIQIHGTTSGQETYTKSIIPVDAPQNVNWSIKAGTECPGVTLVQNEADNSATLKYNDGATKVANGQHIVTLVASSNKGKGGSTISQELNVLFSVSSPDPSTVTISGDESAITMNEGETVTRQYSAAVLPADASQSVKWVLDTQQLKDYITLDENTGFLTIKNTLGKGNYTVTFHAESTVNSEIKDSVSLSVTVNQHLPETVVINGGDRSIDITAGVEGTNTSFEHTATVTPTTASQDVTWHASGLPNGVDINSDTGVISWNKDSTEPGTYQANIWAASKTSPNIVSEPVTVTFNIDNATVKSVNIIGETDLSLKLENGKYVCQTQYLATVNPSRAVQDVTWSIEPHSYGSQVAFDPTTATLTCNFNQPDTCEVTIKATSTADPTVSSAVNVSITPTYASSIDVLMDGGTGNTISFTYGDSVTPKQFTATVKNAAGNTECVPQDVSWSAVGLPNYADLDADGNLTFNNDGNNTPTGTYHAIITATSTVVPSGQASVTQDYPITITIGNKEPEGVKIYGDTTVINEEVDYTSAVTRQFYATVVDASGSTAGIDQTVTWAKVSGDNEITISNTGLVTVGTGLAVGEHSITFTATSTGASPKVATETLKVVISNEKPSILIQITASNSQIDTSPEATNVVNFTSTDLDNVIWKVTPKDSSVTLPDGVYMTKTSSKTANLVTHKVSLDKDIVVEVVAISVEHPDVISNTLEITVKKNPVAGINVTATHSGAEISSGDTITYNLAEQSTADTVIFNLNNGATTLSDVSWSYVDTNNKQVNGISFSNINQLTINDGTNPLQTGNHTLTITGIQSSSSSTASFMLNVNVIDQASTSSITASYKTYSDITSPATVSYSTSGTRTGLPITFTLKDGESSYTTEANWSYAKKEGGGEVTGITFENNVLYIDKSGSSSIVTGTYNLVITGSHGTTTKTFDLKVNVVSDLIDDYSVTVAKDTNCTVSNMGMYRLTYRTTQTGDSTATLSCSPTHPDQDNVRYQIVTLDEQYKDQVYITNNVLTIAGDFLSENPISIIIWAIYDNEIIGHGSVTLVHGSY